MEAADELDKGVAKPGHPSSRQGPSSKLRKVIRVGKMDFTSYGNIAGTNNGYISDALRLAFTIPSSHAQLSSLSNLFDHVRFVHCKVTVRYLPIATNWTSSVDGSQYSDPRLTGYVTGIDSDRGLSDNANLFVLLERGDTSAINKFEVTQEFTPTQVFFNQPMVQKQWYTFPVISTIEFHGGWACYCFYFC